MTPPNTTLAKPRILHVYKDYYPPVMGGIELTINILANGCKDHFDVSVLVNSGSKKSGVETINGVRVVRVKEWGRAASAPISPAFISALRREARGADLLHFHHPNPTADLARLLGKPKPPAIMTYHSDVVRQKWAMAAYAPLQKWMLQNCRVIMPTSPNYMESSPWLREHRDRCTVVPLGLPPQHYRSTPEILAAAGHLQKKFENKPLIVFVGRLRYYKGLHFLVQAMKHINAQLLIVGSGNSEAELRHLAANQHLKHKVHFLGDLSHNEKLACLYAADIFCMPSHLRSEAFGLSQVEAMFTGLPVVSTTVDSGVPYVNKDGESGLTVPPENPEALASAITRLLKDDDLRLKLGEQAQQRALKEFTSQTMCDNVMAIYRQVLGIN